MLVLTFTVLAAIYLFGPDLLWRWILSFVVPRRTLVQTRGEEITRAVLVALVPLLLAVFWAIRSGAIHWQAQLPDLECFFAGIYSQQYFDEHRVEFFHAVRTVLLFNWALIVRLYTILLAVTISLVFLIKNYGRLRTLTFFRKHEWAKDLLATLVIPRVSEWYVFLSRFGLPSRQYKIVADVLTGSGILYKGDLEKAILAPDGSFSGVLLSDPARFRREEFLEHLKEGKEPSPNDYWTKIAGKTFIVLAKDISTINLEHVKPSAERAKDREQLEVELSKILNKIITVEKERS